jgi:hypothetical protein
MKERDNTKEMVKVKNEIKSLNRATKMGGKSASVQDSSRLATFKLNELRCKVS